MPKPNSDRRATECKHPWPMVRLGDVCEVRAGANYKDVEDPNGRYPIYGTGGIMGRASQYRCPAHSAIVGRKGTLDNPFLVHEPFWNIDTCFLPFKTSIQHCNTNIVINSGLIIFLNFKTPNNNNNPDTIKSKIKSILRYISSTLSKLLYKTIQ